MVRAGDLGGGPDPRGRGRVQVRQGHTVVYDVDAGRTIRSIHVAGVLDFDPDRDTRLDVGLIKIQAGDDASEDGFDCDEHVMAQAPGRGRTVPPWWSARPTGRSRRATPRRSGWSPYSGWTRRPARPSSAAAAGWTSMARR